jgi:predicted ArsR family transcriptional regulator
LPTGAVDELLHSSLSWKIIDFLKTQGATESELHSELGVSTRKLRAGLRGLANAGIVVRRWMPTEGPMSVPSYSLGVPGGRDNFPPRNYMFLSESIFRGIARSLGPDSAKLVLHDIGIRAGEDLAQSLLVKSGGATIDPDAFVEHFVKGILNDVKAYPRLIKKTKDSVEYEQYNCPFQELADRYPGLMCDAMDEGVHEGLDRKLSLRTERILCKGHHDSSCRFRVTWERSTSSYRSNTAGQPGRSQSASTSPREPGRGRIRRTGRGPPLQVTHRRGG